MNEAYLEKYRECNRKHRTINIVIMIIGMLQNFMNS